MTRMKQYLAAAAVAAALAVSAPAMAQAVSPAHASARPAQNRSASVHQGAGKAGSASAVRALAPGERVAVGEGLSVWLTDEGKYTSSPSQGTQFTPKADGGQSSGVNLQAEPVSGKWFVSGVYLGQGTPSKVEVTTTNGGVLAGHALQLAGEDTWGAFYLDPTSALPVSTNPHPHLGIAKVTVYDAAGHVITSSTFHG
ncbi:hypothetical protein [Streptomyces sp. NBC_01198]|uniref:hypothetical protein n=1 Tax=Streptomyces sp. NBC_01198 TaxID=2903769 RepID=UPI002E1492F1|nr:hypothetical protein OG702_11430 [Streptomyces sp. NBC_01198]